MTLATHSLDDPMSIAPQSPLDAAAATHVGRRERNEDAWLVDPAHALFAVADGMGGHVGGSVASGLTVEALRSFYDRGLRTTPILWQDSVGEASPGQRRLDMAIRLTQRAIEDAALGPLHEMGSTLVAMQFADDLALIAHVGDSRAYRLRDGKLEQLTKDHSLIQALVAQGSAQLAASLPARYQGVITRSLGPVGDSRADFRVVDTQPGDVFLACSDGLSGVLDAEDITNLLGQSNATQASRALVDSAYAAGGSDNITAVVVRTA
jgi:serine/threonine protein phosphatase PrpC